MDRKRELKQTYKEIPIEAGVYQIKNTQNQKIFIASTRNLRTLNGKQTQLKSGFFMNKALNEELKEFGAEAFIIEVLEVLEKKEEPFFDEKDALKKLEAKWLEKLQPFGERGYN
ncbi:MAG: GIY-YIG nuclease family protein [Syntrophomonadaceae bacterium]|nr:GIY-YIG nuclease family protein [Syntrophomonadaceae bacterium]